MSGADVEIVSTLYGPDGVDWAKEVASPTATRRFRRRVERYLAEDLQVLPIQPAGEVRTVIVGVEAYLAGMQVVMEAFKSFRITAEQYVPVDGGVLVYSRLEGETIEGSQRFSGKGGAFFELEDGLIRRIREFDHRGELLEAGGITAEDASRLAIPASDLITV